MPRVSATEVISILSNLSTCHLGLGCESERRKQTDSCEIPLIATVRQKSEPYRDQNPSAWKIQGGVTPVL
jgi:hypothetical protein